ncbi:MAG: hypothetical protein PHN21_06740 [Erysipelotrichaceae bacterium]|nr:hypothetical protein [Erysipelotrichaceae bacterium]
MHDDKEYAYSPYGSLSEGIIDGFNEYGYKGEVHDNQSLQYLRARYYHTKLTQFISIDTYKGSDSNPLSQNRYSFASNNPYKYSDPSGHFITSIAGDKVYIAGTAASKIASANNTKTPTVDKPLTENQVNDIIYSYNPGPSNTNVAWRLLVQEKLQADYLAQQQAIEYAIPKGAKIVHEEFNRTVTQEAYDNYLEQVKQSTEINDKGILSKIGNFVTGFVKAYVNVDAFKDLATSTWDFFSNPQENFNWKSLGNYLDSNLQNMALVAGTIGAAALSLSALPFLAAGGAMLGTIATYAGLTMGIAGGVQIASGLAGYSLAGDKLSTTDRLYRVMSGGFNVLGGNSLLKGGLKLTQNNSKILTGITNTIDSVVAKTVSTAKDIGRRALSAVKDGIGKIGNQSLAGFNKAKSLFIKQNDDILKDVNKNWIETGDNEVYLSKNADSVTQYVGITNNFARRQAEHIASKGIEIEPLVKNLSRVDARSVEQVLIDIHGLRKNGGTLLNKINSISRKNPIYVESIERGFELLKSIGYINKR